MNGLIHSHDHMAVVSHIQSKCACYLLLLIWIGFPYPYHQMGCTRALSALGVTWPRDGTFPCSVVVGETKLCHHFGKHSSSQTKPWVQFFYFGPTLALQITRVGTLRGVNFSELAHFLKIYPMESNSKNFLWNAIFSLDLRLRLCGVLQWNLYNSLPWLSYYATLLRPDAN